MIIEKIREFVEAECKKPTSKYGYEAYLYHFIPVVKYAKLLAGKLNADQGVVELAAWLHDIGSIIKGRENHHITGAEIAGKKLKELGYPDEKIERVTECIVSHRGSKDIPRKSVEAQIIADADAMSHFDNIAGIFKAAYIFEYQSQGQAQKSTMEKLENCWKKLSPEAREIIKEKYEAAKVLLR